MSRIASQNLMGNTVSFIRDFFPQLKASPVDEVVELINKLDDAYDYIDSFVRYGIRVRRRNQGERARLASGAKIHGIIASVFTVTLANDLFERWEAGGSQVVLFNDDTIPHEERLMFKDELIQIMLVEDDLGRQPKIQHQDPLEFINTLGEAYEERLVTVMSYSYVAT